MAQLARAPDALGTAATALLNWDEQVAEVIAVVALEPDGSRRSDSNWGPEAELAAFTPTASVGVPGAGGSAGPSTISRTSGSSATIAGIAALAWGVHPEWRNTDVRHRLRMAALHPYQRNWQNGYGHVDAFQAVGGMTYLVTTGDGCVCAAQGEPWVTIDAVHDGDGPFQYRWSSGETTPYIHATPPPPGQSEFYEVAVTDLVNGWRRYAVTEVYSTPEPVDDC